MSCRMRGDMAWKRKIAVLVMLASLSGCGMPSLSLPDLPFSDDDSLSKCPAVKPMLPEPRECVLNKEPLPSQVEELQKYVLRQRKVNIDCKIATSERDEIIKVWESSWEDCGD